jgi:uncharacterized membrane protein
MMITDPSVVRIAPHPILRILVSFPIACFCCALATDLAYVATADMLWADFSDWLLAAGIAVGVLAAIGGLFVVLFRRAARSGVWPLVIGGLLVLILAFVNNLVHSRDAWTSVMPEGVALSAATVVVVLVTAWAAARAQRRLVVAGARL